MKHSTYILNLSDPKAILAKVGGKSSSLARMARENLPIPGGFHITTEAYKEFIDSNNLQPFILSEVKRVNLSDSDSLNIAEQRIKEAFTKAEIPEKIVQAIITAYKNLDAVEPRVAVRSSATAEDLPDLSFAGQQETFLNIQEETKLNEAVKKCWASLWTARSIGYRTKNKVSHDDVSISVFVQIMVPADASGVLFTANPMTGNQNQMVINAAWGLGESIVGGTVTPDTIVIDKTKGKISKRDIATKEVMTVQINGGAKETAVPKEKQNKPVLNDKEIITLIRLAKKIEELFKLPMDIEWAITAGEIFILQARPITTLRPEIKIPERWRLPKGTYNAMRNNIVELMIDPITSLFGTLGINVVNNTMGRSMTKFFGKPNLVPKNLIITVNEHAYYNGSLKIWSMVQILFRGIGIAKRMFTGAVERWTEDARPRYKKLVKEIEIKKINELSNNELLNESKKLLEAAIEAYISIVSGIIPAAWMSEGLFTKVYNFFIKKRNDPPATVYLMGYDTIPIKADKSLYDIAKWYGKKEWQNHIRSYLEKYGHIIYNLDFATPVPADDPTPFIETCKAFLNKEIANPYNRQKKAEKQRIQATQDMHKKLKGVRLWLFRKTVTIAQKYAPLREDGLADVGLSYPLLRDLLKELGRRLSKNGLIKNSDDVFWITESEIENSIKLIAENKPLEDLSALVSKRKTFHQELKNIEPPKVLFWGIHPKTKQIKIHFTGEKIKGVAASPGQITAPASVIHGPEDFSKMKTGNVLVAPLTTPAWTTLFTRASAIVTDIGGPLSHGSIVAREYDIPAVLGTGSATKQIQDDQVITVDGSAGVILLKK